MKKIFYSVLLFAGAGFALAACSNGDYNANPASNANTSVNPLAPLDSTAMAAFAVVGKPSFINATINGGGWSSGDSSTGWIFDSSGTNIISGFSGGRVIALYLKNVYAGNIYKMGYNNKVTYGIVAGFDSSYRTTDVHTSYMGNSGEVQIIKNNSAEITGTFYFQAVDSAGDVINVSSGCFDALKN